MFPAAKNPMEQLKQNEYCKMLIKKSFDILDFKKQGTLDKK